jgi:hypothetical protein
MPVRFLISTLLRRGDQENICLSLAVSTAFRKPLKRIGSWFSVAFTSLKRGANESF